MVAVLLLGLSCVCSPLVALVLDYNSIKSSAEVQGTRKSSQCITDQDCNASKFCLKPEDEVPFCATCRGLRRRCKRNAMCCPGTICLNDVCSQTEEVTPTEGRRTDEQDGSDSKGTTQHQIQENNSKKGLVKSPSNKGQEGESCLRTSDCAFGLCCARHFGPKSVSQFSVKDWSVPAGDTKMLLKVQKFSNAVIVALVCLADHRSLGCHNDLA